MQSRQIFHAFQLNDHTSLNKQIQATASIKHMSSIKHRHDNLRLDSQSIFSELYQHGLLIETFKQPGPKLPVHLISRTDYPVCKLFKTHILMSMTAGQIRGINGLPWNRPLGLRVIRDFREIRGSQSSAAYR